MSDQARTRELFHKTDEELAGLRIKLVQCEQDKSDLNEENQRLTDR
jgi:hypothetical protein